MEDSENPSYYSTRLPLKRESTESQSYLSAQLPSLDFGEDQRKIGKRKNTLFSTIYNEKQRDSNNLVPYVKCAAMPIVGQPQTLQRYYGKRKTNDEYEDDDDRRSAEINQRKKRIFTFKFKMTVVKEALRTTAYAACQKFYLTQTQVSQWKNIFLEKGPQAFLNKAKQKQRDIG